MELEIVRADGSVTVETIRTTDEHPWKSGDAWLRTDELSIGIGIVTLSGAAARVRAVSATGQREATYNFEVAEFHTYFVGQGGYWVHNACFGFWGASTFRSATESVLYHFGKHGAGLGAKSAGQYARMAIGFAQANAPAIATAAVRADGTQKFSIGAYFIIVRGAEIVSFGLR